MQRNDRVGKILVDIDGKRFNNIINVPELAEIEGLVEVPGFASKVQVKDGITSYPEFTLGFKEPNGSSDYEYMRAFKNNNETKDIVFNYTDAHGNIYRKLLLSGCECHGITNQAFDAGSPTPSQFTAHLTPFRIQSIKL